MTDPVLEHYDRHAESLARASEAAVDADALREFTRRLPAGAKILDAGLGAGRDLALLRGLGFDAEGFDGSAEMVRIAQGRNPGARVWRAEFLFLQLPEATYDGIWAHQSLIHLPAPGCQRALATFFRALKPGGILFVSIRATFDRRAEPVVEDDPPPRVYRYHPEDFASLLRQNGFTPLASGTRGESGAPTVGFVARRL